MSEHTPDTNPHAEFVSRDEHARRQCLDPARSFIVQAPAGSGKTELLIQRVLALLATVQAPEEIIAITFTRKAAAEMRVRILRALDSARHDAPQEEHARRTRELARSVMDRDEELQWHLREQPSRLRVMTIDALNGWLTRQMPWISGMGAQPAIADQADDLYREAVRSVLLADRPDHASAEEIRRLLVHLDNRYAIIEDLFVQMLAIRDQWNGLLETGAEAQAAGRGTSGIRGAIEQGLRGIIEEQLAETAADMPAGVAEEILALARHAAAVLRNDDSLPDPGPLAVYTERDSFPAGVPEDLPAWNGIAQLLLTGDGTLRKPRGINRRLGFLPGDPAKERMHVLLENLSDAERFIARLDAVRRLPDPAFTDAQWDVLGSIMHLLRACLDALHGVFARRGTVDHAEIAAAAQRALGSDLEPTDLAMMLEYRIRHLLVDEFQDTSSAQYRLIGLLTAGWSAEDGHTLFLVGDPMQSIYRFREAEVGLFLRVWEQRRIGSVRMEPLRLYRNFRSQETIVRWVNDTFAGIMPPEDDPATGAVRYASSEAAREGEADGVTFLPVFGGGPEAEAREVARVIGDAATGTLCGPVRSIGVLVRSRNHLRQLVPRLREQGVSFQAVEIEPLGRHPAVIDAMTLTRALAHDGDRTAWLALLRAPWCGATLADIHALCADDPDLPVSACLADPERRARCTPDAQRRFSALYETIEDAHAQRGRKSLRRLIEGCWTALGAPATIDTQGFAAAMAFFDMLEECDEGGDLGDLARLAERAAALYAPPDPGASAQVQLMTIHKAKGLQFDVVVVPRLDGVPRSEQDRLLLWLERPGRTGLDFILAPVHERGGERDAIYGYVRHVLTEKARHEHRRLLYVAATRARSRLILTAPVGVKEGEDGREMKNPHPQSFLSFLWHALEEDVHTRFAHWCAAAVPAGEAPTQTREGIVLQRLRSDWRRPLPPEPQGLNSNGLRSVRDAERAEGDRWWIAGEEARQTGTVVHLVLARVGTEGVSWWRALDGKRRTELLRALFARSGRLDAAPERLAQAEAAVDRMLDDPRGAWILEPHAESEQEVMLVGRTEDGTERVILDRTFVDDAGTRWIIDYKTSMHEGGDLETFLDAQERLHEETLRRYARIMHALDPRPVRIALYFPLLRAFREIRSAVPPENPRTA